MGFLEECLTQMEFPNEFVDMIMECVARVSYRVSVKTAFQRVISRTKAFDKANLSLHTFLF